MTGLIGNLTIEHISKMSIEELDTLSESIGLIEQLINDAYDSTTISRFDELKEFFKEPVYTISPRPVVDGDRPQRTYVFSVKVYVPRRREFRYTYNYLSIMVDSPSTLSTQNGIDTLTGIASTIDSIKLGLTKRVSREVYDSIIDKVIAEKQKVIKFVGDAYAQIDDLIQHCEEIG